MTVVLGSVPPLPAQAPPAAGDGPSSKTEIFNAMQDVQRKYGSDAVMLQGHLMSQAVHNGAIGETVASVGDVENHDGKRFLVVQLETGIVYNDREISAAARPARLWSDIVEASLRKFHTLTVPADGIALRLGYRHREYDTEAEVRAHFREQPGTPESAVFYLLLPDVIDLLSDRITAQQLVERSTTLVNDTPAHFELAVPTPGESSH